VKKEILIITPDFPYPPYDGVKIPVWNRILYLSQYFKLDVIFSSMQANYFDADKAGIFNLTDVNFSQLYIFEKTNYVIRFFKFITTKKPFFSTRRLNRFSIIELNRRIKNSNYSFIIVDTELYAQIIDFIDTKAICIISPNDSISLSYFDELRFDIHKNVLKNIFVYFNYSRSKKYESNYYEKFDYCQLVSKVDATFLKGVNKNINTIVFPIGVSKRIQKTCAGDFNNTKSILIVGRLAGGNLVYVRNFIESIWINLSKKYPNYNLVLVSRIIPNYFLDEISKFNVIVLDNISDKELENLYYSVEFVISPVKKTTGMLNKIVEAMSFGKTVLGFNASFKSLEGANNYQHFIGAEDESEMQRVIKLILMGEINLKLIGNNARNYVEKKLTWDGIMMDYREFLNSHF